jgi:hypothetical protein
VLHSNTRTLPGVSDSEGSRRNMRLPDGETEVKCCYQALYEAAGAADATACSRIGSCGGFEISWVTEKGGPRDPTTEKDAGGTPGSKITPLVLGLVEGSVVRSDSRGFGVAGPSSKCAVASIVW